MRPAESSAIAPSLVSVTIASSLMKPPYENTLPGLPAVRIGERWIAGLPSLAVATRTSSSSVLVAATAASVCCCCCSSAWTWASSWAMRASSSFSFAVCPNATPGATRASDKAIASGRSGLRLFIGSPPRDMWNAPNVGRLRAGAGGAYSSLVGRGGGATKVLRTCCNATCADGANWRVDAGPVVKTALGGHDMSDIYPVPPDFAARARIDRAAYERDYAASVADPDAFWAGAAKRLDWYRFPKKIKDVSFRLEDFRIRWFEDGELNASVNCLDRHLATRGDKTALIWEPDDPAAEPKHVSYRELHARVCKLANALRSLGVKKGDRVTIYLPMIVEAAVAMLACARVGAIHSVVFGGFAPNSIADRVADCGSKLIITADEGLRGGRKVPLKANVDAALKLPGTQSVETVLVVRHTNAPLDMQMPRDRWYDAVVDSQPDQCE